MKIWKKHAYHVYFSSKWCFLNIFLCGDNQSNRCVVQYLNPATKFKAISTTVYYNIFWFAYKILCFLSAAKSFQEKPSR